MALHELVVKTMEAYHAERHRIPEKSSFNVYMKAHHANLKHPRKTRLGKCEECLILQKQCKGADPDHPAKAALHEHIQQIGRERAAYYARNTEAKNSASVLSIIIDGCAAKPVPHLFPVPKGSDCFTIKSSLYGVLDHSNNTKTFYITYSDMMESGSVWVISVLNDYLCRRLSASYTPKRLYLQADK